MSESSVGWLDLGLTYAIYNPLLLLEVASYSSRYSGVPLGASLEVNGMANEFEIRTIANVAGLMTLIDTPKKDCVLDMAYGTEGLEDEPVSTDALELNEWLH